jgi:hypothetical protein
MWTAPIVEELHRIREAHATCFNDDLWKITEDLKQIEKNWLAPKINPPPKPPAAEISCVSRYSQRYKIRGLIMLQTFEVNVEPDGAVHPLEELHVETPTRAILTLLETPSPTKVKPAQGNGPAILALLQTPRFANRPSADPKEIEQRIRNLRHDCDGEPEELTGG